MLWTPFAPLDVSKPSDIWEPRAAVLATTSSVMRGAEYEARLFKLLAYLSRYARQPLSSVATLTVRECVVLAEATAKLMEEESEANKREMRRG